MGTLFLFTAMLYSLPVISEVCSNPLNETTGEFIEIHNDSTEAIDIAGYSITDGDALDDLLPWSGAFPQAGVTTGTTIIPAGAYAILLELDYPDDPWLTFPDGTVILSTGDHAICNGLAASSDPLTLYKATGSSQNDVVSTFGTPAQFDDWQDCDDDGLDSIPFDPGQGLSIGRYPLNSPDCQEAWFAGEPTPGQAPEAPPDTFIITIDSLFMNDMDPILGSSVLLTAVVSCWGTVSPDTGEVILFIDADGDSIPQWDEVLYSYPAWSLVPGETDTLEVFFPAPETGWYPAVCSAPGAATRIHFSTGGGINPIVTEVMANPLNEDQEEFIEVFYPGPGVFPLAGCSFTDGDAVDQIISFNGKAYIISGQAALILDPEYQGTLNIPEDTPLFSPANTTIGNGLTTDDPILLYLQGEPSLAALLSTAGTPLLFDDPLMCDDDGLDNIAFDPGDGCSMERISPEGPDAEFNWIASQPGGTPGVVPENQGWTDLRTDSIYMENTIVAVFSNCGVFDAEGLCTVFSDMNGDLQPSSGEVIHEQTVNLSAGQSDTLSILFSPPDSGLFVIAATIHNPSDTTTSNNTRHCSLIPDKPAWPVITEVLCNPANEDCDEFVELFFPGPGMVDITEYSITDNDADDELIALTTQFLLPGGYALILDPEYEEGSMPYDIPSGTAIFHPANTTIGDGLSSTDPLLLLLDSLAVSTYGTPDDPDDDIPFDPGTDLSVERITPSHPDAEENWISNPSGPTPGAPPEGITEGVDYCIVSTTLSPPMGQETTDTQVEVKLTCSGTDSVATGELCIRITADGTEIHSCTPIPPVLGDTLAIKTVWRGTTEETVIMGELLCSADGNTVNNTSEATWNPPPVLCINEVFYHETEWIELFNGTEGAVSLEDYLISDPACQSPLPEEQLASGEFIILTECEDDFQYRWGTLSCPVVQLEQWPTLNNSGDSLTLTKGSQAVDMVPYSSQWGGNAGSSLERRSHTVMGFLKENWGTSLSNATPGEPNSIGEVSSDEFLCLSPTVFNPPETPLLIQVNLPMQACNVTVKVFDVRGMVLEELYSSIVPGEVLILEWFGNEYPIGRYIVFAEAVCAGDKLSDAQVVILARPLQ
ncbi:MAG: lamin tail domain-containing protein [Candidatus Sabulitectum sp.]|nr:lamin tail domain-containing protein [Candidatus Sabulitectum sp.]